MSNDAIISLFSGAGGMSLGFSQAGLKPSVAADHDKDACATYERNLGLVPFHTDLSSPEEDFLKAVDALREPLFLIGGPPCQGFSSAGQKDGSDARNRLSFSYLGLLDRLRPKWFLFENVEGLLTSNRGRSLFLLCKSFIQLGYSIRVEKVNFAGFGLPQGRKRVIIAGNRVGIEFAFPAATRSFDSGKHRQANGLPQGPTLLDAIASLGDAKDEINSLATYVARAPLNDYDARMRAGGKRSFLQHASTKPGALAAAISALFPGQTMKDLPEKYWHESFRRRAHRRVMDGTPSEKRGGAPSGLKRLRGDLASLTITSASPREFIHPHFDRPLTFRECARLQSFPDDYDFVGSCQSIATQIGNSFPAIAARAFAEHFKRIEASFGSDTSHRSAGLIDYELTQSSGMSPALSKTNDLLSSLADGQASLPFDFGHGL